MVERKEMITKLDMSGKEDFLFAMATPDGKIVCLEFDIVY